MLAPEPDILEELPLLELPRVVQETGEEAEDNDKEFIVTAESRAAESDVEKPMKVEADVDPEMSQRRKKKEWV